MEEEEEERERMVHMGIVTEEDGEILDGFVGLLDGGGWDNRRFDDGGGLPDELESDLDSGGDGFNGGFPDELESDTNSDTDDGFSDKPDSHDEGS